MRLFIIPALLGFAACATAPETDRITYTKWEAIGYLSPAQQNGEDLGRFETLAECQAAVDGWKSKQVVGNPVDGDCIAVNVTE